MNIGVIGVNHNVAPISIRESVSFTEVKKIEAINYLLDQQIEEVVILSTCNRSEIYIYSENILSKIQVVKKFYSEFFAQDEIDKFLFCSVGIDAIEHLFNVTAGLDSIVIGEDQILGQVKEAHEFSMNLGSSKKIFNKLFREAVTTAKDIKTTTKISENPLSISYIAVKYLKEKLGTLIEKNALVIGNGKMSNLAISHLQEEGIGNIYLANRSREKALEIEGKYDNVLLVDYEERYELLKKVDIVISATASPHIIVKYEDLPEISNNIEIMDIALPRDIDPKLNELSNINIYDIDNLKEIKEKNDNKRKELARNASLTISDKIQEFLHWMDSIYIDPTIQSLNDRCFEIREDTVNYIMRKVELSRKDQKIVDKMINSALKRLIREPILNLKQVKDKGKREEYIKLIEELFEI